jgi:hypothetical protein
MSASEISPKPSRRVWHWLWLTPVLLIVCVFFARVPLINFTLSKVLPEGFELRIGGLDLGLLSRSLRVDDIQLRLTDEAQRTESRLGLASLSLEGIAYAYQELGQDDSVSEGLVSQNHESSSLDASSTDVNGSDVNGSDVNSTDENSNEEYMPHHVRLKRIALHGLSVDQQTPELALNATLSQLELNDLDFLNQYLVLGSVALTAIELALEGDAPLKQANVAELKLNQIGVKLDQGNIDVASVRLAGLIADMTPWQWLAKVNLLDMHTLHVEKWSETIKLAAFSLAEVNLDTAKQQAFALAGLEILDIEMLNSVLGSRLSVDMVHLEAPQINAIRNAQGLINLVPPESAVGQNAQTQSTETQSTETQSTAMVSASSSGDTDDQVSSDSTVVADTDTELVAAESDMPGSALEAESASVQGDPDQPAMRFLVKQVRITPYEESEVEELEEQKVSRPAFARWRDESLSEPVDLTLSIDDLTLLGLDSDPEADNSTLALRAHLGEHSPLTIDAAFKLATIADTFDLDLQLKHMELPAVSPYTVDAMGYSLSAGQFSTHVKVSAKQRQLAGNANLKLVKAKLKAADKEAMDKFNKELTMPLPTALSLLENGDGEIELDMPLKGSLDDPSFSAKGIMRFLMLRAVKEATVYYLKAALLPQNTLFSIADLFGGMVYNKLTELPAIRYKKDQIDLGKEQLAFLDRVAVMMTKKIKLRFKVCGISAGYDGEASVAKTLADQRVAKARRYLVDEKQIAPDRLMQCLSEHDPEIESAEVKFVL